jgi:predicted permease
MAMPNDVRYAVRSLRQTPGFTLTAILTLAIGIGAATAVFGQVNAVFWRPLPVSHPEELRTFVWTSPKRAFLNTPAFAGPVLPGVGETFESFSYPAYEAMRDATSRSLSDLACWMDPGELMPVVMGDLGFASVQFVSGNYFRTVGVAPILGRALQPDDSRDEASAAAVAVLTYRFWQRTFGGDRNVLTKSIVLNGTPFAIVGVLPDGFFGLDPAISPDVIVPFGMYRIASAGGQGALASRANWSLCRVIGRIRSGVSDEQARTEAEAGLQVGTVGPGWPPAGRAGQWQLPTLSILNAAQGLDGLRRTTAQPLLILMTVVAVILLIACANIAGLLMARGTSRQKEIATRLAIGATRAGLVRQLLTESFVLAAAGGLAGFGVAVLVARLTPSVLSQFLPPVEGATRNLGVAVTPDFRVFAFAIAVVTTTGVVFGLAPAVGSTRVDLMVLLKQAGGGTSRRIAGLSGGKAMVALQTALSIVLLVGAGLFIRTVINLRAVELGYEPDGLLYVRVEPRAGGMRYGSGGLTPGDSARRRAAFFEDVVKHLEGTPGVISATASLAPPLSDYAGAGAAADDPNACTRDFNPSAAEGAFEAVLIAPRYFETIRLPLLLGRDLVWAERAPGRQRVAVVNEAFVRKFFAAGKNPIGETLGIGRDCPSNASAVTVVGVVADSRTLPRGEARPMIYTHYAAPVQPLTVILRTAGDPASMIPALRRAMSEFDANVPLFGEITPLDLREQQIRQERLLRTMLIVFGSFALLLCCLGIYGLLAYTVGRRTPDIGIHMALGAQRRDVVRMVVADSLAPVAAGLTAGIALAFGATRFVQSMLFGIAQPDALTIAAAAVLFFTLAGIAAAVPARHASRIDPVKALAP